MLRAVELEIERSKKVNSNKDNIGVVLGRVMYYLEHSDQIMKKQIDPVKKAQFFGAIFKEIP